MGIMDKLTPTVEKLALKADIHKPELLLGGGIVFMLGGAALAGWGTLKAKKALDELEDVEKDSAGEEDDPKAKARFALELAKAYSPAAACLVISCVMLVSARNIEHARLAGVTAEYNALMSLFNLYRDRVREDQGEQKDLEYYHGAIEEEVEEETEDKKGRKRTKKKAVKRLQWHEDCLHRAYSEDTSTEWVHPDRYPGYNQSYLEGQMAFARDKYLSRSPYHYLLLTEAAEALGLKIEGYGDTLRLGWHELAAKDSGRDEEDIDFGIISPEAWVEAHNGDWRTKAEDIFHLNFNCDGDITPYLTDSFRG